MFIAMIRYLQGYLHIRITGYSPERFLNLCSYKQIYLWGLQPNGDSYEMFISVKGFRKLKPILKKTRTKVLILERIGMPFFLHKYRKRKVFFCGAAASVLLIYVMSLFVWNIHIEGNLSRTDETILEFLETKDVRHGMKKSSIDCGRIVKDIRKEFDDIVWVSAYVKGTRLMIKVKENTDTFPIEMHKEDAPYDIVADKSGKITGIVTRNGVPLVKSGDEVKEGDVLVSGRVEVKNDAGEVVNYQYQNADANIEVETTIAYESEHDFLYLKKQYQEAEKSAVYAQFGNYRCLLGSLKNKYKQSERSSEEYQLKIGEHFSLPVACGIRRIKAYETKEQVYTKEEMRILLSEEFQKFCNDLERQDISVLEKDVRIYLQKESAKAKGSVCVREKIGMRRETEVIPIAKD